VQPNAIDESDAMVPTRPDTDPICRRHTTRAYSTSDNTGDCVLSRSSHPPSNASPHLRSHSSSAYTCARVSWEPSGHSKPSVCTDTCPVPGATSVRRPWSLRLGHGEMLLPSWMVCTPVAFNRPTLVMLRGAGRYLEDCSEYLLSSAARGNTSELKHQVTEAARPAVARGHIPQEAQSLVS
jgi:hypothetical protein